MVGQGHDLIKNRLGQPGEIKGGHRQENGSGFSGGPANAQDRAGNHAGHGIGQNIGADHLPFGGPQRQTCIAEPLGNGAQRLFTGHDNGWQNHAGQSQTARQDRGAKAAEQHKEAEAEQAKDDGGNPGQGDNGQANHGVEPALIRILGKIDCPANPKRQRDGDGAHHQIQGADNGWKDAA